MTWIDGFMGSVERRDCEGGGPTKGAIESVGHSHMECGGKRSATRLWLERLVLRWIRYKQEPKRRRASLAAALHKVPERDRQFYSHPSTNSTLKFDHEQESAIRGACMASARGPRLVGRMGGAALSRNDAVGRAVPPHPGPLPRGEGEPFGSAIKGHRQVSFPARLKRAPSPWGEGRDEGERDSRTAWMRLRRGGAAPNGSKRHQTAVNGTKNK